MTKYVLIPSTSCGLRKTVGHSLVDLCASYLESKHSESKHSDGLRSLCTRYARESADGGKRTASMENLNDEVEQVTQNAI